MGAYKIITASGIFLALGLQTAFASPTPTNAQPGDMVVRRDEYLNGIRLADENETPPATVVFPKENVKRDLAVGLAPRQGGAPTNIPSTDGKYDIGSYLCSQSTEITKYFLYSSDLQQNKAEVCQKVFDAEVGADGTGETLIAVGARPVEASKILRAKVKVASTIWHKGSVEVFLTMTNWGMGTDPASKTEAVALCADALNYIASTCHNAILGTDGTPVPVQLTHEAQNPGSVVWHDLTGKKMLEFNVGLGKH